MFGKRYPNCVKKTKSEEVEVDTSSAVSEELNRNQQPFYQKRYTSGGYKPIGKNKRMNSSSDRKKTGTSLSPKKHRDEKKDFANMNIIKTGKKSNLKTALNRLQFQQSNIKKFADLKTEAVNAAQQAAIAIAKKEKIEGDMVKKAKKKQKIMSSYDWRSQLESELGRVDECWKTHKKVGMKMKGGKLVPNCVPKNEEVQLEAKKPMVKVKLNPSKKIGVKVTDIGAGGKEYVRKDTMKEAKSPAWQRKAGKSESGGLNAKGVASYRAANPGSKLKTAVTTEPSKLKKGSKSANRRKSFCARMKGMKKRLTSAKTARDPDSRINKSLRKWNC